MPPELSIIRTPNSVAARDGAYELALEKYCTTPNAKVADIAKAVGRSASVIRNWRDCYKWTAVREAHRREQLALLVDGIGDDKQSAVRIAKLCKRLESMVTDKISAMEKRDAQYEDLKGTIDVLQKLNEVQASAYKRIGY